MRKSFQQLNIDKELLGQTYMLGRDHETLAFGWLHEKLSTIVCLVFLAFGLSATHPVALAPGGLRSADSALP